MRISDWSSDVCSSDLTERKALRPLPTMSSRFLVDLREKAAALALPWLIQVDCTGAPSRRWKCSRWPPSSVMAMLTFQSFFFASASAAAAIRSEEHTSELQSLMRISYAVFCLKKKKATHTKLSTSLP